jgi:hypothetical protein
MAVGFDFNLEPKEAIAYLESKGYKLNFDYDEMEREAHHKAFTVAKVTRLDLLYDIHESLIAAQRKGIGAEDWIKEIKPTLQKYGWLGKTQVSDPRTGEVKEIYVGARRLKNIFNTNMRVSYSVAKYQAMRESLRSDIWVYKSALLENTRASHSARHNKAYHRDSPFWDTWYPPNAWNCKCYVQPMTRKEAERKGYALDAPYEPNSDKDWGYNVGAVDPLASVTDRIYAKSVSAIQSGEWGKVWARDHLKTVLETAKEAVDVPKYRDWIKTLYKGGEFDPKNSHTETFFVGALDIRAFDFLAKKNQIPKCAAVLVTKSRLAHIVRESKGNKTLSQEHLLRIPEILANPIAKLWDRENKTVLYVFDIESDAAHKLVMQANYTKDGKSVIKSGGIIPRYNLNSGKYDLIEATKEFAEGFNAD